jgi:hypothetical protein
MNAAYFRTLFDYNYRALGRLAAAVTQLGHSPGDLDMIAYFNRRS